jgi:acetylornithine/succinyldiaminopimelate/putrescine aminotransferase
MNSKVIMTTIDLEELTQAIAAEVINQLREQKFIAKADEPLLKMDVVAKELRVTPQTIIAWRKKGYFPGYQIGSKMYYKLTEVQAGMKKRQVGTF